MASCTYNPGINSVNPYAVLNVIQQSQNVSNNTSTVRWELLIYRSSAISSSAVKDYSVTVNGTTKSGTTTIGGSGTKSIASGTVSVPHNADGTKTITFSFSLDFEINWAGKWIGIGSANGSMALSTIPRATTPALTPTTIMMGNSITINLPRASSAFTHTLQHDFYVGEWTTFATGATTTASLTVPIDWASRLPNSTSGGGRVRCLTYNGSTLIGEKIVNFTATVPIDVVPSISTMSVTEAVTLPVSSVGFVQGKSKLKCTIMASGSQGSTIKSYSTKIGAFTYVGASFTTDTISVSGIVQIIATVTDSRGRTASKTQNITVEPYSSPVVSMSVFRANEQGEENGEGSYAVASVEIEITSLENHNFSSYSIEYKQESGSGSEWKTAKTGSGYNIRQKFNLGKILSDEISYNFRIIVMDSFGEIVYNASPVPTAFTPLDFLYTGKGVAFGKVSVLDMLEIAMEMQIYKSVTTKNNIPFLFDSINGEAIEGIQMSDNNFMLGRGGYLKQTGRTVLYGNRIDIESKEGVFADGNHIGNRKEFKDDEYCTGDLWLGKKVFQKVIRTGTITSQDKAVPHGITDMDFIWADLQNSFMVSGESTYPLPRIAVAGGSIRMNQAISIGVNKTQITLNVGSDANFTDGYITLRYTKN